MGEHIIYRLISFALATDIFIFDNNI